MPTTTKATPDDIEMASVFSAIKKDIKKLVLYATAAGALTYLTFMQVAPRYESETELAIVARGNAAAFNDPKPNAAGPDLITTRMDKEAINTHVRALQSTDLIAKIARDLKLDQNREFNNALGPLDTFDSVLRKVGIGTPRAGESDHDRVMGAIRERLEVYSAKESRFIGIRVTATDPVLAADIANDLAEAYRASLASQGVSEIDEQQSVIKAKIDKLIPEVAAAETATERFRGEINVFKGGNTGLNEQQLSELTAELTRAKTARGEIEARARSAREMMKAGSADALPDVQRSPLIQNLVQQRVRIERQISELSASLLPAHPRMRQLNADLAGLQSQLSAEIGKLVQSLDKEAAVARDREESVKKSLDDLKARVVDIAPQEAKLRQLEADAKAKRNELENLQGQFEANRKKLDSRSQPVEAQVISKAQPSSVPVYPKKGSLAALISIATLLLGLAWTITKALFQGARAGAGSAKSATVQAADTTGAQRAEPELPGAATPILPVKVSGPAAVAVHTGPDAITSLAQHLAAARPQENGHRTLITGETAAVSPGADAIALASSLAQSGSNVVLIDWSPSGTGVLPLSGIARTPGFNDMITATAGFEQIVQRLPESRAHVIMAGAPLEGGSAGIDADYLNAILDALDEAYDHIVVVSAYGEARDLFETILGRFDAGVTVTEPRRRTSVLDEPMGTFLGFEVADIDIIRLERQAAAAPAPAPAPQPKPVSQDRLSRALKKTGSEQRLVS